MTREKAVKIIKEFINGTCLHTVDQEALETLIPELKENEDERIRKEIIKFIEDFSNPCDEECDKWIAYLEKQKEQPTDAKLERVIKASRSVLNNWLDGTDCPDVSGDFAELEYAIREYDGEEKQKEPHYTKRNALFDKCVENCDPKTVEEVNKRVDDIMNMPKLSAFEQALTNFIGYWEDDEERWPSKFVKKHSKHILDMAREELQKEQKLVSYSPLCNTIKDKIREYVVNHFVTDTVVKTDVKSIVKAMEEGVRLGKEEQKPADLPAGFYVTLPDGKKYYTKEMRCNGMNVKVVEPKPAEWSEEDERMRSNILNVLTSTRVYTLGSHGTSVYKYNNEIEWLKSLSSNLKKKNEDVAKLCSNEWSEEDEKRVKQLIYDTEAIRAGYEKRKESLGDDFNDELIKDCDEQINWLKSLRPSWKPSEEQMESLRDTIINTKGYSYSMYLPELYEQLKKL